MNKFSQKLNSLADQFMVKLAAKKPAYYGVFLDPQSRSSLLSWWDSNVGKPLLAKPFAHHMTVKFKPSPEDMAKYTPMIGQSVKLKVTGYAENENGQAVLVEPNGVDSDNAHPHVTVSCSEATSPAYSKELLSGGFTPVDGPVLIGTFDQFPRS
jgi:hypothetical protein